MHQARVNGYNQPCRLIALAVGLVFLIEGCAHIGECDSSDSTISCCLKEHPGQYERCAAVAPPTPQSQPNRLLPGRAEEGLPEAEAVPIPELPTAEEKERWRADICEPHYAKCIRAGGDRIPGRKAGETQCQACFDACMRHGYWPLRANYKSCPGA